MRFTTKLFVAATISVALGGVARVAQAQNWTSYGWGLGNSLLYPLTYLPYRMLYSNTYGNSGYALNNLMYQGSNAPYGYLPYGGRIGQTNSQYAPNTNYGQNGYGSQPPTNSQGQPVTPYNNAYNSDPNAYPAGWQQQPPPVAQPIKKHGKHSKQAPPADSTAPNQSASASSSNVISSVPNSESLPPIAPDLMSKHNSLFADGFFQVIGSKFNGDIGAAMKDKEMYSWAQALNVVDRKKASSIDLSASRKDAIEKVLKDDSLDSQSKLETLKILLRP